jgi:hypothetical protein
MFDRADGGAASAAVDVLALDTRLGARLVGADALRRLVLPVPPALRPLFPDGGLPRGAAVGVDADPSAGGSASLALNLTAAASQAGSWVAVVGMADLGLAALGWAGLDPSRVLLVDRVAAADWPRVVGTLLGAVDVVVAPVARVPPGIGRRLATAARERNAVVVTVGRGDGSGGAVAGFDPLVRLQVVASTWEGLGDGHGHLRARRVQVERRGRGSAARPERHWLWLPDANGQVTRVDDGDAQVLAWRGSRS